MNTSRHRESSPPPNNAGRASKGSVHEHDVRDPRSMDRNPTRLFAPEDERPPTLSTSPNYRLSSQQRTRLDSAAQEFIHSVPLGDIISLVSYINRYSDPLLRNPVDLNAYLDEAVIAFRNHDSARAKNCVEKGIIVDECRSLTSAKMTQYFKLMHHQDPAFMKRFRQRYEKYLAQCGVRAKSSGPATGGIATVTEMTRTISLDRDVHAGDGRHAPSPATAPRPIPQGRKGVDTATYGSYKSDRATRHGETSGSLNVKSNPTSSSFAPDRHFEATPTDQTPTTGISRHLSSLNKTRSHDDDPDSGTHGWRTLREDNDTLSGSATIKGDESTAPSKDELHPSYVRRSPREAGKFFSVGRVFAILEHQEYNVRPENRTQSSESWLTMTSRGVWVLSRISRFVVVRKGHGHAWACPISTYGGQGVAKRGFRPVDVKAHAIIYSGRSPPAPMANEPRMPKQPIAVDCERDHHLHPASRIDFSRVTTVEHNRRALHIGQIRDVSRSRFSDYWRDELLR